MKPATFFMVVGQMALAIAAANETSAADETTACVTTTIFTTTTVTVTKPQHPSNIIVVSSTPSESPALSSSAEPVLPTPAPVNPNVTASEPSVVITSTSLSFVPVAPYPTTNGTWTVVPSHTAPHSSGSGVSATGTASATPPQFTAGVGIVAVDGLALGLLVVGAVFLTL
ncbi:hypothetical protein PMIN06_002190 [Paraphaeosphaeria minitans]|uniref:Uncharacterized protein n=1 Tax=Paraphaeosphaeria minitans TaxID=565426 RepID=A0A9P6GIK7_9PLEO|nr:hypothetical protein PMIN01_05741 [Paraphaeosphaeria minitans]